jgi:hypothetical protein
MVILFEGKVGAENRVLQKKTLQDTHHCKYTTLTILIVKIKRNADAEEKRSGVRVCRPNNKRTFYSLIVETMNDTHAEYKCNFKYI